MYKRKINRWLHWLVIYPLAGVGALVAILFAALIIEESGPELGGRTGTAIARMSDDTPYYEYGHSRSTQEKERTLAEQMKTWDGSYQIISWEDLSASILRGDRPNREFGCIYKARKNCPGCRETLMKVHYNNGWMTFCPNCRNQLEYKQEKQ